MRALAVVSLLQLVAFGSPVLAEESLQSLGVETVEGVACDHLAGEDPKYGRYEFWIGRDDHMLRKIESAVAGTKFEEIRKDVRVNAEIPASVFQSEN